MNAGASLCKKAFVMLSIAFFFLVLLNLWFVFFNSQKIVYVDGARILQEYKGAGDTKKEFDQKVEQWKKNSWLLTR